MKFGVWFAGLVSDAQNPAMEGRLVNGKNFLVGVHSRQVVHVGADIRQDYLPKVCFDMFDVPKICSDMFDVPKVFSDMFDLPKVCFATFDMSKVTAKSELGA